VKEFLSQKGVAYEEYDVAADKDKAGEMMEKAKQMVVPVIVVDDTDTVIGFNQSKLEELLSLGK
jgi:glutaredoxin